MDTDVEVRKLRPNPILDEAAQTMEGLYGSRINALTIDRVVVGVFFVGVKLSNGYGGVAYNPPEMSRSAGRRILKGRTDVIRGMGVTDILAGECSNPFLPIIRLAVINALSALFFEGGRYRIHVGRDLSGIPGLFKNRRVCMVGAIIPLLKRLHDLAPSEVTIIDRKQVTQFEAEAGFGTFLPTQQTAQALARCETAVFTGAAVANGSIASLLEHVPEQAVVAVVGPTAGFVPEPFFRRNVAVVGTAVVKNSDLALEVLGEGGSGYALFRDCMSKINILNVDRLHELGIDGPY